MLKESRTKKYLGTPRLKKETTRAAAGGRAKRKPRRKKTKSLSTPFWKLDIV